MNTNKPRAADTATTDLGLRRESRSAGATPLLEATGRTESGVAAALQSSLRFASAGYHRTPKSSRCSVHQHEHRRVLHRLDHILKLPFSRDGFFELG